MDKLPCFKVLQDHINNPRRRIDTLGKLIDNLLAGRWVVDQDGYDFLAHVIKVWDHRSNAGCVAESGQLVVHDDSSSGVVQLDIASLDERLA